MQNVKRKQLEAALSRMGAKVSLAADQLIQAEKEVQAASKRLVEVQREIEQIYITLEEPLLLNDKDK